MKRLLLFGVCLVLAVARFAAAGDEPHKAAPPTLTGSWDTATIYYYEGTPDGLIGKLQCLEQFFADGRAVLFLAQNPIADGNVGDPRTACVGEWKHRKGRTFDVTLYCIRQTSWTDAPAVPHRILNTIELAPDGQTWTASPFYYQVFDGTKYVGTRNPNSWGETTAIRLPLVPIE